MNPNYAAAAAKAQETYSRFRSADPLQILCRLPNVKLISFESADMPIDQDSFSCVQENKYIVIYNSGLSPIRQRSALARELGHVIMQHDGTGPEDIWMEEATCFAYHFLCLAQTDNITVKYRPDRVTVSMSFKDMQTFDSMLALKESVSAHHTLVSRFIGRPASYSPDDVEIRSLNEQDIFGHWNNYSAVLIGGKQVGYCGHE